MLVALNSTPPQGQRTAAWRCRVSERDRMRDARGQHRRSEVGALLLRDVREQGTGREPNCGPQKVFLPPQPPPLYVFQAGLVPREGGRKEDRGPNLWKHPTVSPHPSVSLTEMGIEVRHRHPPRSELWINKFNLNFVICMLSRRTCAVVKAVIDRDNYE